MINSAHDCSILHILLFFFNIIIMQAIENLMIPAHLVYVLNSELLLQTVELLSDGRVGDISFDQTITVITGNITTAGEYN